jgi:peptidyl-prolyl cis-trans isomerase C
MPLLSGLVWFLALAGGTEALPETVAKIGERVVARRALDEAVDRTLNSQYFHSVSPEKKAAIARDELQKLIRAQLDLLGAIGAGLKPDLRGAEKQRASIEATLGPAEYERSLTSRGWSPKQHAKALAEALLAKAAYRRFVMEPSRVSNADVRKAFAADPARFRMQETVHVLHLLLRVEPGSAKEVWTDREAEAIALLGRVREGESFEELAGKRSDDMYRVKGGDLGWVHKGRLLPPVEAAAWGAKDGDVAGPIRSEEGFHLLKVLGRRAARQLSFDEVSGSLRASLEKERLAAAEARWYAELRAKFPVTVLDAALEPGKP